MNRRKLGRLLECVIADDCLLEGWSRVRANDGAAGVDGVTVRRFGQDLFARLGKLRREIQAGTYFPQPLRQVVIEKAGKKPRSLAIPTVRDRVLQSAACRVLQPLLEPTFEPESFAYRPGLSVRMAIEQVVRLRDDGFRWVVDADIASYFDEVAHPVLLAKLRAIVDDESFVELVRTWIGAALVTADGRLLRRERGIPQGSPLSPLLANAYLDELDEAMQAAGFRLVRYADDFIVLCRRREAAVAALELTETVLRRLALRLNPDKTHLAHFKDGFDFLGARFLEDEVSADDAAERWLLPACAPVAFVAGKPLETAMQAAFRAATLRKDSHAADPAPSEAAPSEAARIEAGDEEPAPSSQPADDDAVRTELTDVAPLLRTAYMLGQGLVLGRSGDRLTIRRQGVELCELPIHRIDQVLVCGNSLVSSSAIELALEHRVGIHFQRSDGLPLGSLVPGLDHGVELRRLQLLCSEDAAFRLEIARALVQRKLRRSASLLRQFLRHHPAPDADSRLSTIEQMNRQAASACALDVLRGCEGMAARAYFEVLQRIVPGSMRFTGRDAHPSPDPFNALLSYGYGVLLRNVHTLLMRRGFDCAFGFLHAARDGRASLALDLMEPYRAPAVDAVVLTLVSRKRVKPDDFSDQPDGRCEIAQSVRKLLVQELEAKLNAPGANGVRDMRRRMAQDVSALARAVEANDPAIFAREAA